MKIDKVLIADDYELIINGICDTLNKEFEIGCVKTFTNPEDIIEELRKTLFDLYILDLEFQEMSGFELIEYIRQIQPDARIIIITMHEEIWNINHLLKLNINGVVLKKGSSEYLNQAVINVMNNRQFFCPRFKELSTRTKPYRKLNRLRNSHPSQSELTVLKYIVDGFTSKQIAELLYVTEDTIEAHRKNLFVKLEARNVAHLVSIAIRQHLVE